MWPPTSSGGSTQKAQRRKLGTGGVRAGARFRSLSLIVSSLIVSCLWSGPPSLMSYDAGTQTEVYQIVGTNVRAHSVVARTAEEVCVEKAPNNPGAPSSARERDGAFCLDREELESNGVAVHEGSGKTFYLRRGEAVAQR